MAAQAVIGSLRVDLGLNSAQLNAGLKNAQSGFARLGASMAKFAAVAGAATGAALVGIAVGVRRSVDEMDRLTKAAQSFGIPVEDLSRLKHAADLSGTSVEGLGTAVGRLSRNMMDASDGLAIPQRAFDQLGIEIKNSEGRLKSVSEILPEIADRFSRMEDGATKTALSMVLMGRSGATMIPMLNGGAEALSEMMKEADALGLVFDERVGKAAERFNDNLTRLGRVKDGIIMKLTAHLLPALEGMSQRLIDAVKNGNLVENMASRLIAVFDTLQRGVMFVYDNFGILTRIGAAFIALKLASVVARVGITMISLAKALQLGTVAMAAFKLASSLGKAGLLGLAAGAALAVTEATGLTDVFGGLGELAGKISESMSGAIEGALAKLGIDTSALTMELQKVASESGPDATNALTQLALAAAGSGASMKSVGDTVENSVVPAMAQAGEAINQVGQTLNSAFGSAIDGLIAGTFKAKDAIASLLSDLARLLANSAFKLLFSGGGGLGGGGLLGSIVGSIFESFKLPGLATGGSFKVGGTGGVDSQLVAFKASPNETVDVRTPGQMGGGPGVLNVNVNVSGARGNQEIQEMVATGVNQGLRSYDKTILPGRVQGITKTASRRGDLR